MPDLFLAKKPAKEASNTPKIKKENENVAVADLKTFEHNPLSSFCYMPRKVKFRSQHEDEKVLLLVRRHPLTNFKWLALVVLMAFGPLILNYFPLLNFLPVRFQNISILFWYLVTMAIFIEGFLSWFFSVNIVTNKRVIDVDFLNLIYREITDAEISKVEDVTVKMGSVVRTLFDYGDVNIQTAGETPQIEFQGVPHPDRIERILSELRMEN